MIYLNLITILCIIIYYLVIYKNLYNNYNWYDGKRIFSKKDRLTISNIMLILYIILCLITIINTMLLLGTICIHLIGINNYAYYFDSSPKYINFLTSKSLSKKL